MKASKPVLSRMSICILSYVLVQKGLSHQLPPAVAMNAVLAGSAGFISYVGVKWAEFQRKRALVYRLLNAHNVPWGNEGSTLS